MRCLSKKIYTHLQSKDIYKIIVLINQISQRSYQYHRDKIRADLFDQWIELYFQAIRELVKINNAASQFKIIVFIRFGFHVPNFLPGEGKENLDRLYNALCDFD